MVVRYDGKVRCWFESPHMHIPFLLEFLHDFSTSAMANPCGRDDAFSVSIEINQTCIRNVSQSKSARIRPYRVESATVLVIQKE
jgi:hypothetical protein